MPKIPEGNKHATQFCTTCRQPVDDHMIWCSYSPDYCPKCNYNDHRCPGCGEYLDHGTEVCRQCKIDYEVG